MSSKLKKILVFIIAAVLALGIIYVLLPKIKEVNAERIEIQVFACDIQGGRQITDEDIKTESISKKDFSNQILDKEDVVGKFTRSFVYANDFVTEAKIQESIDELQGKMYLSLKVSTEQALAGELVEGDIVTIFSYDDITERTYESDYLKYVKIVRVKNRLTEDIEAVKQKNVAEDLGVAYKSDSIIPEYITVEVNAMQAKQLIDSSQTGFFYLAYRGNVNQTPELLELQEASIADENEE